MRRAGKPLFQFDARFSRVNRDASKKFTLVGIDEAGRGPWAGPVVASAVCLPPDFFDSDLADSKLLSPKIRDRLHDKIIASASFGIGVIEVESVDTLNILRATHCAMKNALLNLVRKHPAISPDLVIVDGRPVPEMGFAQKSIVKGDRHSAAIAAASVLAKVTRDRIMFAFHDQYPEYGFAHHKGYGTKMHQKNLNAHGPCPIHRKSFAPIKNLIAKASEASMK